MSEPGDRDEFYEWLDTQLDEQMLVPVMVFSGEAGSTPMQGVAIVIEQEDPTWVAVVTKDLHGNYGPRLMFDRERLKARIDDPTIRRSDLKDQGLGDLLG